MKEFILENCAVVLLAVLAFVKVIAELTGLQRDPKVFGILDEFMESLIPNQVKRCNRKRKP